MSDYAPQIKQLKLYTSDTHPCSYLDDQEATTLFADPEGDIDKHLFSELVTKGFWRSGSYLFKPDCINCQSCIPIRIPLEKYTFSHNEKRILKQHSDLQITIEKELDGDLLYPLYKKYILSRHTTGDMFPPSKQQFENFLKPYLNSSHIATFYEKGQLVCAALMDEIPDGYLAVYTFFDPDKKKRSIGHATILWQILFGQVQCKKFLYLGYWINGCKKMSYKSRYKPCEIRIDGRWVALL